MSLNRLSMKYPIGIQSFEKIRQEGCVYVDKTDLVYSLTNNSSVCFLSRPRRFGKSLLVSTLEAYFLGRKELFKGLKIDALETEWKTYPVFRLDFNGQDFTKAGVLEKALERFVSDYEMIYGSDPRDLTIGDRFSIVLQKAYRKTGQRCVVLVDEYDKPLLDVMSSSVMIPQEGGDPVSLEDYNRNILKGFYSTFKGADDYLKFVFLTGVTKFSQVSVFSGFNQPDDISMTAEYDALCGVTEQEMVDTFQEPITEMAKKNGCDFAQMVKMLRKKYDGYHFSEGMTGVYNPFSLLNAFSKLKLRDYWFSSGTPTYLLHLLNKTNENLDELIGKYYSSDEFINYKADEEMPLPMIYQSGYLTIKDYDRDTDSFLLDFPNDEVKRGFVIAVANNYFKNDKASSTVRSFVKSLKYGDLETFRTAMTAFLASIPYTMHQKRDKEQFFHYTFYLLLRILSTYVTFTEKPQSQGRVDCIVETDKFVYIFEFKLDGTAEDALKQIEDKGYATEYAADTRKLFKVGVNFSSETGTISDWAVR